MVQITKEGLACSASIVNQLAQQFERDHVFRLPGLLHPELLRTISSALSPSAWSTRDDGAIAREALPERLGPVNILNFAANTSEFLDVIREITQCSQITSFYGRVYRMAPGAGHFDSWHSDLGKKGDRLIGMSVNLGSPYHGGIFRLRELETGHVLCELPNTGPGDAICFRISPKLQHMVTTVEGAEPKTAFAGWFFSGEIAFYTSLTQRHMTGPVIC